MSKTDLMKGEKEQLMFPEVGLTPKDWEELYNTGVPICSDDLSLHLKEKLIKHFKVDKKVQDLESKLAEAREEIKKLEKDLRNTSESVDMLTGRFKTLADVCAHEGVRKYAKETLDSYIFNTMKISLTRKELEK